MTTLPSKSILNDLDTTIQDLEREGTYKHPGVLEGDGIQHAKIKEISEKSITEKYD